MSAHPHPIETPSPGPANSPGHASVAGGVWALELLTEHETHVSRSDIRRVFHEIVLAEPGDPAELWWDWFSTACAEAGLSAKVVDCAPDEAVELARDGARLVRYHAPAGQSAAAGENGRARHDESDWYVVWGEMGRPGVLRRAAGSRSGRRQSVGGLRRLFQKWGGGEPLRFVVVDPGDNRASPGHEHEPGLAPLPRLWRMLAGEWSDIWIVVVFAFVMGLLLLATPLAVEALVNTVAFGRFLQPILVLAGLLFVFLGFSSALRALQTFVVEIIQRRLFARVAGDLAYRLPRTRFEAAEGVHMPELVNRFFDVVTVQKAAAQLLLDGVTLVLTTIIGMAVLAFYHPFLFGFDLVMLASIVIVIWIVGRQAVPTAIKESKCKYKVAAWFEDVARCPTTFRGDGGADFALERADHLIQDYLNARRKHFRVVMRQVVFVLALQAVASTVVLALGGWLVVSGQLTLGQLVASELIVTVIVGAFAKIGKYMESFYDLLASVDKLGMLFDLPVERPQGMRWPRSEGPAAVELQGVACASGPHDTLLEGLSIEVPPGETWAIVGPAGSGKSMLLDMLFGLREPTRGQVKIDGRSPSDLRPDALRRRVGLVRGVEVFHGTIEENVHLHRPEVSAARVRESLAQVGLLERLLEHEEGLHGHVESDGFPLTENQCRLLCLARAIAPQPALLLVDGLLDALSDEELDHVLTFLTNPANPWTLVIATGRAAIAERCARRLELKARHAHA